VPVNGPVGVMAVLLAETAAGGAGMLFLTPMWREVRWKFFLLTGAVLLALAVGAATSAVSAFEPGATGAGRAAIWLAWALAAATLLWLGLLSRPGSRAVARLVGIATVPLGVVMLIALARDGDQGVGLSSFELLSGAAFTGAVLVGLLLGHWYLTERKLGRAPIERMAWILAAAVVLETAAVVAGWGNGSVTSGSSLNPLLSISSVASLIAIGMVACTGLIAVFIRLTLRGTRPAAVQSATGFFYLAVITAFTAELAAKIGFLR
jgi:hypothetical protein